MTQKQTAASARFDKLLGIAILILLLLGCLLVLLPFLTSLMWSVILCFAIWPLQRRLVTLLKGKRTLAAFVTTLGIALTLLVPVLVIGMNLPDDIRSLNAATQQWMREAPPTPPAWIEKIPFVGASIKTYWLDLAEDARQWARQISAEPVDVTVTMISTTTPGGTLPATTESAQESKLVLAARRIFAWVRTWLLSAVLLIGHGVAEVAMSVFFIFFLLRDGEFAAERFRDSIGRIAGTRGEHLIDVAGGTVRGVVYGILGTAVAQGLLAGIGFIIAGIPGAAPLGLLTALLSFLPVGPPLIWIPASLWLFHKGYPGWGVFMFCWGILVSSVDNVVKPWLISQGSDMPFILIFIGVLGGAMAFGIIGVFIGPTLIAVAYRILKDWLGETQQGQIAPPS